MKEFKIEVPLGYEIDQENSTFEKIIFKQKEFPYTDIKCLRHAVDFLSNHSDLTEDIYDVLTQIKNTSQSAWALTELNIIRKALNYGYDLEKTKNLFLPNLYPVLSTEVQYSDAILGKCSCVGKMEVNGVKYIICQYSRAVGFNDTIFSFNNKNLGAMINEQLFGCATYKIAQHFGRYFADLFMIAQFGDFQGFKMLY